MDQKKSYEAMILLEPGQTDFQAASEPIRNILARYGAEVLSMKLWDERKLAYEIRGRKRGMYVLTYFKADPLTLAEIEHDCELDERILRQLILRRDRLTQEQIDAETPASSPRRAAEDAPARPEAAGEESHGAGRPRRDRESYGDLPDALDTEDASA